MSDGCGELFGKILLEVVFRSLVASVLLFIDRQCVERLDLVIRWGRRAQNTLRAPRSLRVFADTDPGMLDGEIRFAAVVAFCTGVAINIGLLVFILEPAGKLRNRACFGLMVIYSVCMTLVVWLALALSRRRLERRSASCEKVNHAEGDMGLTESIRWFAIYY